VRLAGSGNLSSMLVIAEQVFDPCDHRLALCQPEYVVRTTEDLVRVDDEAQAVRGVALFAREVAQ